MKYCAILLLMIFTAVIVRARNPGGQDDYHLYNRLFVKWSPSSLLPFYGAAYRFGAEYCFAGSFGVVIEGGPLSSAGAPLNTNTDIKVKNGFGLWPELRGYFAAGMHGRMFGGLQGLYRHETMTAGYARDFSDNKNYYYDYSQSGGTKTVFGLAAQLGFIIRLGGPVHLEMAAGIGAKNIQVRRDNFLENKANGGITREDYGVMYSEENLKDGGTLPYVFATLKISFLLGAPIGDYGHRNR